MAVPPCWEGFIEMLSKENEPVIHSDPEIMGGTPMFVGVPLATLLDCLEAGQSLSE
jgi:uncharacterized protein (DUF433 family)